MSVLVLSLLWVVFSFFSSVWFCQKCNLQRNIRDRLFLCGLQAQLILIYSVWCFFLVTVGACVLFGWAWKLVVFRDACNYSLPVVSLRDIFHTRSSKLSPHCSPLSHSLSVPSPCAPSLHYLKVSPTALSFSFFKLFSCHSHSQLLTLNICIYFLVCIITASLSHWNFLLQVPAVLLAVLFFPSSSRPSPSAERWMNWTSG